METAREGFLESDRLLGIRYWAVHTPLVVPRFRVFKYLGSRGNEHFFESVKGPKAFVHYTIEQIQKAVLIRPFCIDTDIIEQCIKELNMEVNKFADI